MTYKIKLVEAKTCSESGACSTFVIEPLEAGQGVTLGNAIRRTLLSDLSGYAITGLRINNLQHEFSVIPSLREDVAEMLLNLKKIVFKPFRFDIKDLKNIKGVLSAKGPGVVTASMFVLPQNSVGIVNPNLYICTIADSSNLYFEVDIEKDKAYRSAEENRILYELNKSSESALVKRLYTDSLFMPVVNANYKVKMICDSYGNVKESLIFEIETNGSLSPLRALQESLKFLMDLFAPLLKSSLLESLSKHS